MHVPLPWLISHCPSRVKIPEGRIDLAKPRSHRHSLVSRKQGEGISVLWQALTAAPQHLGFPSAFLKGPRTQLRENISQLLSTARTMLRPARQWQGALLVLLSMPALLLPCGLWTENTSLPAGCAPAHASGFHWWNWEGRDLKRPLCLCPLLLGSWHPTKNKLSLAVASPSWVLEWQAWEQIWTPSCSWPRAVSEK